MTDDRAGDQDLVAARANVLVSVDELRAHGGPSLRPATLHTNQPLTELPTALAGKLAARAGRPAGGSSDRRHPWRAARDPLRLTATERRILARARSWQSRQAWIGPLSGSIERCLVLVALDVVEHIASSPLWASRYLDDHRVGLNLAAELDEIDEQAFRLAEMRHVSGPVDVSPAGRADVLDQGWNAVVDRVAALSLYANRLRLAHKDLAHRLAGIPEPPDDAHVARLVAGAVRDELASDQLRALADDLRRLAITRGEVPTWP